MIPGEVSTRTRTLRLEANRFGGSLRRGLPVRGCCKARTYRAERGALDLQRCVKYGPEGG